MKIIVGLGNPGREFEKTRHNVGFMVLDAFKGARCPDKRWGFSKRFNANVINLPFSTFRLLLIKPQTFMNKSGDAVLSVSQYYKVDPCDILVVHDDLDLPVSVFRLQRGRNAAGHRGVESIMEKLGTKDFWRLRVGIDNGSTLRVDNPSEFVLERFSKCDLHTLRSIEDKLTSAVSNFLTK